MGAVLAAYGRALGAQLRGKILLLSLIPCVLSVLVWAVLLWFGWQPLVDAVQSLFAAHDGWKTSNSLLGTYGLGMLKMFIVPLIAIFLLLPLMALTALVFIGVAAMPAIVRHVAARDFPALAQQRGGSVLGSVGTALAAFAVFALGWLLCLPLYAVPPLALVAQALLWGWLSYRVFAYDALSAHASAQERADLMRARRPQLLLIGTVSGLAGAVPGIVWAGGAVISWVFFPVLAALSIWLYVMIFIFTGVWFSYFCLQALADARAGAPVA
ncbi:MAG: EI24 domain-containing protein [Pseudomonadota bacterium]